MSNCEAKAALAINGGKSAVTAPLAARHHFGQEEKAACNRIIDEAIDAGAAPGYNGPERTALGKEFSELLGGGYAECVNGGTTSVYVALRALDIQPFTEIICGPVTDPGGIMPIVMMNCIPIIADSGKDSFNISLEGIKKVYSPERTSAILVAHIAGEPCDMEAISAFAKEKGIYLIEDCAQSHGAAINGKPVGTFGDTSGFSMMFGKHTCVGGQGGLVFTKCEKLYWKLRQAADRGKPYGTNENENVMASLNFNMDDMHCAIGRVQIKKMFPIAKKRREVINAIMAKLSDVPVVRLAPMPKGAEPSYWFLRLIFDGSKVNVDKNTFCAAVTAEGIGCNTHYAATPYIGKWYTERIVFGNSGYPWAAPEYKGDKEKRYSLADLPNAAKALDDTIIIYPNESWTEQNIEECALAFRKAYEAYKK